MQSQDRRRQAESELKKVKLARNVLPYFTFFQFYFKTLERFSCRSTRKLDLLSADRQQHQQRTVSLHNFTSRGKQIVMRLQTKSDVFAHMLIIYLYSAATSFPNNLSLGLRMVHAFRRSTRGNKKYRCGTRGSGTAKMFGKH